MTEAVEESHWFLVGMVPTKTSERLPERSPPTCLHPTFSVSAIRLAEGGRSEGSESR